MKPTKIVQGTLYEEGYLIRTLGQVATSPDVALTELVANAWDAGANRVIITIPHDFNEYLIIEDDGTGLTQSDFQTRWMTLGYNRLKHQGTEVIFPPNRDGKRTAYGRNGIGRHGLLCFNDEYMVETRCNGEFNEFTVTTLNNEQPFVIKSKNNRAGDGHGTKLFVSVIRKLPNPERTLELLAARFLHDPSFTIILNGNTVELEDFSGFVNKRQISVGNTSLTLMCFDTQKSGKTTRYQGIAFWQDRKLIGEPSWILGRNIIVDGRTAFAKRYSIIVQTNDLAEYILSDWTGFMPVDFMDNIYSAVSDYTREMQDGIARAHIEEIRADVKQKFQKDIVDLPPLAQFEINCAIDDITYETPTAKVDELDLAVKTAIKISSSRSGAELLKKISNLSEEDIEGLNSLLENWTVKDALSVLGEIDRRLSVIEIIRKLAHDKTINELKILHPLMTEARWLFGSEFDTLEYTSNQQLRTVAETIFKIKPTSNDFINPQKRPDIVVAANSTFAVTCLDSIDRESQLTVIDKILIIELKKGGSQISRDDVNQTVGYVEDFLGCSSLPIKPQIDAFVVGATIGQNVQCLRKTGKNDEGVITVTTYDTIVDTATRRLFNLREKLRSRYENVSGLELYKKVIQQGSLMKGLPETDNEQN